MGSRRRRSPSFRSVRGAGYVWFSRVYLGVSGLIAVMIQSVPLGGDVYTIGNGVARFSKCAPEREASEPPPYAE